MSTRSPLPALVALLAALVLAPASAGASSPPTSLGVPPPGANDPSCHSAAHPEPVVLVHGTFEDMSTNWTELAPVLEASGYCVWALDYGNRGTGEIAKSAHQLRTFVNHVLAVTGARRVDIVGHSQGGMMPRWYIKFLGGATKVDDLVGLAPSNHGTTNPLAGPARQGGCTACTEQIAGSPFLTKLNAGDETPGAVSYTQVETRYDEVVTPYTSAFLSGPARQTTNVRVQDDCPADVSEHVALAYDPVAAQWVLNALGRRGPADPSFHPAC
jgi:triacylglycerol lipase